MRLKKGGVTSFLPPPFGVEITWGGPAAMVPPLPRLLDYNDSLRITRSIASK